MRSKALLSRSSQLKTRTAVEERLPSRIADLGDDELVAHCDGCGRHLRLYPGPANLDPRTRLVSLLERLVCGARCHGRACGGLPRRLVLVHDERRWVLDASGWAEGDSAFWEPGDFEALAARSARPAAF
jgi:hypothetical protein